MVKSSFRHCAATVTEFIGSSHHTLDIGVCWLTHRDIFEALQQALARGVKVYLMINYDQINIHPQGLPFGSLYAAGARVWGYCGPGLLHYKFAVADGERVLSGSFNWTRSDHADFVMVTTDRDLARQCTEALCTQETASIPYEQFHLIPPRKIDFRQLYTPALTGSHDLRRRIVGGAGAWISSTEYQGQYDRWEREQVHTLNIKKIAHWPFQSDDWDEKTFLHWLNEIPCSVTVRHLLKRYCLRLRVGDLIFATTPEGAVCGAGIVGGWPVYSSETGLLSRYTQWLPLNNGKSVTLPKSKAHRAFFPCKNAALALLQGG